IEPGDGSLLACGRWSPPSSELVTLRHSFLDPVKNKKFRRIINEEKFVKFFGPAKAGRKGKGKRCNVFGHEDYLKKAPKMQGVTKDHKDIDLLRLKTVGVSMTFKDEEVLSPEFKYILFEVFKARSLFSHWLKFCTLN
ncbi:hypothetical protein BT69DRAFT_1231986, partial [Atractiella rhizophila]